MQAPPGYGQPVPVGQTTNGLAIASLVLGIVWVFGLGSILAVIFGFVARKQIRESGGRQGGGGMAIAGIVLGFVGVASFILWIVLVIVVTTNLNNCFDHVQPNVNSSTCVTNSGTGNSGSPFNTGSTGNTVGPLHTCGRAAGADRCEQRDRPGNQRVPAALSVGFAPVGSGGSARHGTTQARHAAGTTARRRRWSAVLGREGVTLFS